jgi:hypothetical protein
MKTNNTALWIGAITSALLISLLLLIGQHIFHVADDYCFLYNATIRDVVEESVFWWNNWSGRWVSTVLRHSYFSAVGVDASPWLVVFLLGVIYLSAHFMARALYGSSRDVIAGGLFAASVLLLVIGHPGDIVFWAASGFDWTSGYMALGLLVFSAVSLSIRDENKPAKLLFTLAIVSGFLSGGFGEVLALVAPLLMLILVLSGKTRRLQLTVVLIFSTLGSALNLLAPGPVMRRGTIDIEIEPIGLLIDTLLYGARSLVPILVVLLLLCAHPAIYSWLRELGRMGHARLGPRIATMLVAATLLFPFVISASVFWSLDSGGPSRARGFSVLLIVLLWPLIWFYIEPKLASVFSKVKPLLRTAISALAILVILSINTPGYLKDAFMGQAAEASRQASVQHKMLFDSTPHTDVVIDTITQKSSSLRLRNLSTTASFWKNKCVANVWSLNSVRVADRSNK